MRLNNFLFSFFASHKQGKPKSSGEANFDHGFFHSRRFPMQDKQNQNQGNNENQKEPKDARQEQQQQRTGAKVATDNHKKS